jgi:hypothetical protein
MAWIWPEGLNWQPLDHSLLWVMNIQVPPFFKAHLLNYHLLSLQFLKLNVSLNSIFCAAELDISLRQYLDTPLRILM